MNPSACHPKLIPDNPVRQLVSIIRITRKMLGQDVADHLNRLENRFGESALLQQSGHLSAHPLPERVAAFLVHTRVADDGELPRQRNQINQHRVAMTRLGHPQLNESFPREFQRIGPSAVRDVNANFTGAFAFRLDNRLHDSGFVQFTDKLFVVHVLLPASTGATPAKTSAPAGKAPAGGPASTAPATTASSTPATAPPPPAAATYSAAPLIHGAPGHPTNVAQDQNQHDTPKKYEIESAGIAPLVHRSATAFVLASRRLQ